MNTEFEMLGSPNLSTVDIRGYDKFGKVSINIQFFMSQMVFCFSSNQQTKSLNVSSNLPIVGRASSRILKRLQNITIGGPQHPKCEKRFA